ncbi:COG3014 family protein [Entomomonas asaccharolytica]|uniref:Lipoprotein n=1 Tax=Entomomonas asaccharolytica TaxID=2785331 RepID=A0A974NE31_9GAMM|nr:hypothetical protein [Entomomonas asaccharolytica]QQP84899.1 hypothetical protein JHT90_10880 [Entomomonas asaccharolytica]
MLRIGYALLLMLFLVGCSTVRNYDRELTIISQQINVGDVDAALTILESNNKKEQKDLLYYFEKGELLRLKGDLQASQAAWMSANQQVQAWEDSVKVDPARYVNNFMAFLLNDKIRRYDGYDYEKVMLTTQMALNYLAMGDWSSARVAIRQTHEREAVIAKVHDLLYYKQEQIAQEKGINTQFQDLNGYPVATLNTPSVVNLKNSYQSAFSHYLAGYIYEALGDRDLAAPGYRNAIELRPDAPVLKEALKNLTSNINRPANQSDVLIIMQSGLAPKRDSLSISIPIPTNSGIIQISVSLPVINDVGYGSKFNAITVNGRNYPLTEVTSVDAMSRRALRDDLPMILIRTVTRAATRAVAQQQLNKEVSPWAGLAFGLAGALLEQADLRTWRTLPESMQIARLTLPKGKQTINLPNGTQFDVMISNNYQVVQLVQIGNKIYIP